MVTRRRQLSAKAALGFLLDVPRGGSALFRPEMFLNLVLEFANARNREKRDEFYRDINANLSAHFNTRRYMSETGDLLDKRALKAQQRLDAQLTIISEGKKEKRLELAREIAWDADRFALFPETVVERGPAGLWVRTDYTWDAESMTAVFARGLILLMDDEGGFAGRLCRCRFDPCAKWFLSVKTEQDAAIGTRRTAYCCRDHASAADKERRRIDQQERRARQRATDHSKVKKRGTR